MSKLNVDLSVSVKLTGKGSKSLISLLREEFECEYELTECLEETLTEWLNEIYSNNFPNEEDELDASVRVKYVPQRT